MHFNSKNQQPEISSFVAVTALSHLEKHKKNQPRCLDSWKNLGLTIYAVNTDEQIDLLKDYYPQVDYWIPNNDVATKYKAPTQKISSLLQVSVLIDKPILLINSDIEIYGDQKVLLDCFDEKYVVVGIRQNYLDITRHSKIEDYGLDAFLLYPEIVKKLPHMHYGIGKPFWDYWLPYSCINLGYRTKWIGEPYFYHEVHPVHWTQPEWHMGRIWFENLFNIEVDWGAWRKRQPFPPKTKKEFFL